MDDLKYSTPEDVHMAILKQAELLSDGSTALAELLHNVHGLLQDLTEVSTSFKQHNAKIDKDAKQTLEMTKKLTEYIENCHIEILALVESMNILEKRKEEDKQKIKKLEIELKETKNSFAASEKIKDTTLSAMKKEAIEQSSYTAAMGSVLGSMLWKTSKTEDVINTLIHEEVIEDFLNLANITMNSFMSTYSNELPLVDSREFKYAMSILGVSVNISAHKAARDVILKERIGNIYINHIMDYLKLIKMPNGRLLKRMSLIFLYNISISNQGAILIQQNKSGIENIMHCLSSDYTNEIQSLVLSLMKSLLDEIPTQEFCHQVIQLTSRDNLQQLMQNEDEDLQYLSRKFYNKLQQIDSPTSP